MCCVGADVDAGCLTAARATGIPAACEANEVGNPGGHAIELGAVGSPSV